MDNVWSVVEFILLVLGGLMILTFLVVIHELGHAIVARRNGVVVEEFGIGFPPRAWSRKLKNNVLFSINWLPIGGFVKLKGEHDQAKTKGSYGRATMWQKAKILLAGVTVNWLAAALILAIVSLFGLPRILPHQFSVPGDTVRQLSPVTIDTVASGSPAAKGGLKPHDQILVLANKTIKKAPDLSQAAKVNAGRTVAITYKRGVATHIAKVTLNTPDRARNGYLGVTSSQDETLRSTWSAPVVGAGLAAQFSWETIRGIGVLLGQLGHGLGSKFSPDHHTQQTGQAALDEAGKGVAGPIGILFGIFPAFEKAGIVPLLMLTAIISLTLAIMNILPIPALDGGRLYLALIFRALKQPLTKEREEKIVGYSFYALLLLVLFISVLDIGKFFR